MIVSFKHKGLRCLFENGDKRGVNATMVSRIEEILFILDTATTTEEMNIPGYRLHPLKGDLKGYWSVRVTANWRIIFRFEKGNAHDVDLRDYH